MTMVIGTDIYEGLLGNINAIYKYYKTSSSYEQARAKLPGALKSVVKFQIYSYSDAANLFPRASWVKIVGW